MSSDNLCSVCSYTCKESYSEQENIICKICGVGFGNPFISPTGKIDNLNGIVVPCIDAKAVLDKSILFTADAFSAISSNLLSGVSWDKI